VFLRGDAALREARRLVTRKRRLRTLEAEAAALSMRSPQFGPSRPGSATIGFDSGDFLRIIRDLRRVHSHIAALAYPVLERAAETGERDAAPTPVATTPLAGKGERAEAAGDHH
jgi:phosphate:Na+ symporter